MCRYLRQPLLRNWNQSPKQRLALHFIVLGVTTGTLIIAMQPTVACVFFLGYLPGMFWHLLVHEKT